MTADIRTAAQRKIRLDHLLGTFAVGSKDHSWTDEYMEIAEMRPGKMHILVTDIRAHGIREPILLGSDGRVWDGHHRICAAMHIGLDTVPVEFCAPSRATPTRAQLAAVIAESLRDWLTSQDPEDQRSREEWVADDVLALMTHTQKTHEHIYENCDCGECAQEICVWCEHVKEKEGK